MPFDDDGRVEPGNRGKLIPEIVCFGVFGDVLRRRGWAIKKVIQSR